MIGEDPGLDDLYTVTAGGVVHRWACNRLPHGPSSLWAWTPRMAGLDDRACPECLPGGLPAAP